MNKTYGLALALTLMAALAGRAQAADNFCGELTSGYGPLDYRSRALGNQEVVTRAHFTSNVEQGISGATSYLGDDLNYVLTAIPNHVRALATLTKIALRDKTLHVAHMKYPVECYFERAKRFAANDPMVHASYGDYLSRVQRYDEARAAFNQALALDPDNPTIHFNTGLLYVKSKQYDAARTHALQAYRMGFPLKGLRNQLASVGKWSAEDDQAVAEALKQAEPAPADAAPSPAPEPAAQAPAAEVPAAKPQS